MSSDHDMFDLSGLSDAGEDPPDSLECDMPDTPTPATPSQAEPSPTPATPTPPRPIKSSPPCLSSPAAGGLFRETNELLQDDALSYGAECIQIKVEFRGADGNKVSQTRYTENSEVIKIIKSLMSAESNNPKFKNAAATNIVKSELLKANIKQQVLRDVSDEFSEFLSHEKCPLKDANLFKELNNLDEFDFGSVLVKCKEIAPNVVENISTVCFGSEGTKSRYLQQRILAVLAISSITRNQRYNAVQKILGEYMKMKSSNRQVLQLLHRVGLSLVTVTIRSDMDAIAVHFMSEVKSRKLMIEEWTTERKMLEKEVRIELQAQVQLTNSSTSKRLFVKYTPDELIPEVEDKAVMNSNWDDLETSEEVMEVIRMNGSAMDALDEHLDSCPAPFTVSYDNIDIGVAPNEHIAEFTSDQSLHWCSSVVYEDVVIGNELSDNNPERSDEIDFKCLVKLTESERNHLLANYTKHVVNIIVKNWPQCFPDLKSEKVGHQYIKQFEAGVNSFTGPLVCETESTVEGIAIVIKTIVDIVCPSVKCEDGTKAPIYPTTFRYDSNNIYVFFSI